MLPGCTGLATIPEFRWLSPPRSRNVQFPFITIIGSGTAHQPFLPYPPKPKNVFLCGFRQEDLRAVTPRIKETTEVLYLYKCPRIKDLSMLSEFTELRCVHMYWNHSLECLWDMRSNRFLQAISFVDVSGLQSIDGLKDSAAEYVCLDSADNNGKRRKMQFDPQVLDQMKHLKHLILNYVGYKTD